MIQIDKVGGLIKINDGSGNIHYYSSNSERSISYGSNNKVSINIGDYSIRSVPIANLVINGDTPADIDEFDNLLTAVFLNAGGAASSTDQDIEITDSTKGLIMSSTGNNTRYRITMNDDGSLQTSII